MFGVTNDRQCRRDLRKQGGDSHGRISQRQQINNRLTWYFYTHLITRLLYNAAVQLKAIFGINSPFQRLLFDERKWFSVVSIRGGGGGGAVSRAKATRCMGVLAGGIWNSSYMIIAGADTDRFDQLRSTPVEVQRPFPTGRMIVH
jgi:hypothetical protein